MAAPSVDDCFPKVTDQPKKRLKHGSKKELKKLEALSGHRTGDACNCTRLHCFEVTSAAERVDLISHFNSLSHKDAQDSFLAALINIESVQRKRPTPGVVEEAQNPHNHSYKYHVKVVRNGSAMSVQVCLKAFLNMFGIKKGRVERIRASLATKGVPPQDQRGKHANRPHAFSADQMDRIVSHIGSFRGRQSHYSRKDTRKLYLPEGLNIAKMHRMYQDAYPEEKCCYESYRKIFEQKFNISFGYPRQDTCSECDRLAVEIASLNKETQQDELKKVEAEKELHQRKAECFYERKRAAKIAASAAGSTTVAVAFDYWKNMPLPNITTNDVYYKRQLSQYTFDVHDLGANKVYLYSYDETVANKGSNDVVSMINHFVDNYADPEATELLLFCDSCAGQNKNWTMFRYLHHLVHFKKRFDKVQITFPIRGHSYMECDKDTGMINQQYRAEVPTDWIRHFEEAQKSPHPFTVIQPDTTLFKKYGHHLDPLYVAKCPVASRPLREVQFIKASSMMKVREGWNGPFNDCAILKRSKKQPVSNALKNAYGGRLPISEEKFRDIQGLKQFCSKAAQIFFDNLPHGHGAVDDSEEDEVPLSSLMAGPKRAHETVD